MIVTFEMPFEEHYHGKNQYPPQIIELPIDFYFKAEARIIIPFSICICGMFFYDGKWNKIVPDTNLASQKHSSCKTEFIVNKIENIRGL